MLLKQLVLLIYLKSVTFKQNYAYIVPVHPDVAQEVPFGKTAILHCPSNDKEHNFMFWKITTPHMTIIGPSNSYNREKYEYKILTGRLTIRKVDSEEEGIFACVSKGVQSNNISIRSVRMVVKKDWEEVYEDDPSINALRVFIAIGIFLILIGGSYLLYKNTESKHEMQLFLGEDEDDESNEELFSQPGPSYRHSRSRTPSPLSYQHSVDSTSYKSLIFDVNQTETQTHATKETKEIDPFDLFDELPNFHL